MSDAVAIQVGRISQQVSALEKRKKTTSKKKTKKVPKKKTAKKKWRLERVTNLTDRVLYEKIPKKGYMLVVPKNSIVRDTTENRQKYTAVPYITAKGTAGAAQPAMQQV